MNQCKHVSQTETIRFQQIRKAWLDCVERHRQTVAHDLCLRAFTAIAGGRALPLAEAATQLKLGPEQFQALIEHLTRQGRLTLDEAGTAIAGAAGLSLLPSRHTLILNGRQLSTWCAFDAVGIPAGLSADAQVVSQCVACGAPVEVIIASGHLVRVNPASLTVSLVPPDDSRAVRDGICTEMGFACGCQAPEEGGLVVRVPVAEAMELGRVCWGAGTVPV